MADQKARAECQLIISGWLHSSGQIILSSLCKYFVFVNLECMMWYLFLRCDSLLVSLPPGWVMDVHKGFISRCDSTRSEQLHRRQRQTYIKLIES